MKKISLLIALLCASLMSFATDWNSIAFLGDGAGGGAYTNKYKVDAAFGQKVVNVQLDGDKPAIYSSFGAPVTSCTLPADQYRIEGSGIYLYLTAFTAKETTVSVESGGAAYDFKVFYADGTGDISEDEPGGDPQPGGDLTPATFYGQDVQPVNGSDVTFNWSITRNADAKLTFEISWSSEIVGVVPQVNINDVYSTLPMQGSLARFTTKETYTDGEKLAIFFLIAYTGNAARIDISYTVGSSNKKPGGQEDPETPDTPDTPGEDNQAIDDVQLNVQGTKMLENGRIVIIKNGTRYSTIGQKIQ